MSVTVRVDWPELSVGISLVALVFRLHVQLFKQRKLLKDNLEIMKKHLQRHEYEHEMLINDYCLRNKMNREDLPSRHIGPWATQGPD